MKCKEGSSEQARCEGEISGEEEGALTIVGLPLKRARFSAVDTPKGSRRACDNAAGCAAVEAEEPSFDSKAACNKAGSPHATARRTSSFGVRQQVRMACINA